MINLATIVPNQLTDRTQEIPAGSLAMEAHVAIEFVDWDRIIGLLDARNTIELR